MNVLLIDVDSKIPNIALCKINAFHKQKNDNVKLIKLGLKGYPSKKTHTVDAIDYDIVYVSVIFQINQDKYKIINCDNIKTGGTGSKDIKTKLPEEIDSIEPNYDIYPDNNTSYGFITRGCIRNCSFCFVPEKEGNLHPYNTLDQIIKHDKVSFMDNNFLAYDKHKDILKELIKRKTKCEFNQGLDIRLIDKENALLLSKLKYIGEYIFALDNVKLIPVIENKLKIIKEYIKKDWKLKFFIYIHPEMDIEEDILKRIRFCKENKILPYIMRDISCYKINIYTDIASYCNQPQFFKKMTFKEFLIKRYPNNKKRTETSFNF